MPKHAVILDSARVTSLWIILADWQGLGRSGEESSLALADTDPIHRTNSQRNVGPNSVSSFGEMALGKFSCRSLLMPGSTLYLILTHKSNKPQHACTGSTRQRKNSRRGSCLYPATACAADLISCPSVNKTGHRPGDLSQMGQLSYHLVPPLICSSDVPCAPKKPLDVNTKYANQLRWPGPGPWKAGLSQRWPLQTVHVLPQELNDRTSEAQLPTLCFNNSIMVPPVCS